MSKIPNLVDLMNEYTASQIEAWPARCLHASAIGHPCARSLVYDQVRPAEKHDVRLERIFGIGRMIHEQTVIEAMNALKGTSCSIRQNEQTLPRNEWGIGGRIDFALSWYDEETGRQKSIPVEVKSCSPHVFDSIHTAEEMREHKWPYIRKWPAQLSIYMLLANKEAAAFLLVNKVTGELKWIECHLDMEYAEGLIKKAETVRDSVGLYSTAKTDADREAALPERIPFDPSICPDCSHFACCIPDVHTVGSVVVDPMWEGEVEAWCNILKQTEDAAEQHEEANKKLMAHVAAMCAGLKAGEKRTMITQSWYVSGTMGNPRTVYDVPDDVKEKYKTTGSASVRKKLEPIDRNKSEV